MKCETSNILNSMQWIFDSTWGKIERELWSNINKGRKTNVVYDFLLWEVFCAKKEGNKKEENNGYVVCNWKIHGLAGKKGDGEGGGGHTLSAPTPYYNRLFGHIFKDDENEFSTTKDIWFMEQYDQTHCSNTPLPHCSLEQAVNTVIKTTESFLSCLTLCTNYKVLHQLLNYL